MRSSDWSSEGCSSDLVDDMDGDAGERGHIVEEMPGGKEQGIGEIMRLDLREAECDIGIAELARIGGLGDHVRDDALPQGPGQRCLELIFLPGRVQIGRASRRATECPNGMITGA